MTTNDERLSQIEQTIAYQDQQIQDLSDMVSQQWTEIDRLKKRLAQAKQRLENLENPVEEGEMPHEKPPHY
ncbi:MAG TPA: SlyX family protein [Sphingomonadales bacterium]|nr:SlyX family protein [Sphingomonadales bacterium]